MIVLFFIVIFTFSNISGKFIQDTTNISYRPKHCIENKCIPEEVFSKLPLYRKNFTRELNSPEQNWKQPEYYEFEEGIEYYINTPRDYLGQVGFGAYPSYRFFNAKDGDEIKTFTYFHASWFVYNYQGIKLDIVMNDNIRNYFDVYIEPDIFLLEPTFPYFEYNWTQKITVIVKVKNNPPKGNYLIGVDTSSPPSEYSQKWSENYKGRYIEAGGIVSIGKPFYNLEIII